MQQVPQEQSQRQPPQISLSLSGAQPSNASIPIVFKPLKDGGTFDFTPLKAFDQTPILANGNMRQKKLGFEMKLPFLNNQHVVTSQSISATPYSPQNYPLPILFSMEHIETVFSSLLSERNIQISKESMTEILNIIAQQLYNILIHAAQSSRQRTNVYAPSFSEREITSSPKTKQTFLNCEIYSASNMRNKLFNTHIIDEDDPYEPFFFTNFDIKKTDLFQGDSNERNEQIFQMKKIFYNLKSRGDMFKSVAQESDSTFSGEMEKYLNSFPKSDKMPVNKPAPFSLKANEIFGNADEEEKRKKERSIAPKDIFEALSRMSILFQSKIPLWRLKYFEQFD